MATQKKGKRMSANTDVKLLDIIQRLIKNSEDEFALIALIDLLKDPSLKSLKSRFSALSAAEAETVFFEAIDRFYRNVKSVTGTTDRDVKAYFNKIMNNLAIDLIKEIQNDIKWTVDLDGARPGHEDESEFADLGIENLPEKKDTQRSIEKDLEIKQGLAELILRLTNTEKKVFEDLAQGLNQTQIAQKYGLSKGRISQICSSIRKKAHPLFREV